MRYVSPSEFVRQFEREFKHRYQLHRRERFEVVVQDGKATLRECKPHLLPTFAGPYQQLWLAHDCLTLDANYDYWMLGRSRVEEIHALKALEKVNRTQREESERKATEAGGEIRDQLAWALGKANGDGIHVGGGTDSRKD